MQEIEYILCLFISSSKEQSLTLQIIVYKFGEMLFRLSSFHSGDDCLLWNYFEIIL